MIRWDRGRERAIGVEAFECGEDEPRVVVDVLSDGEDGDFAVADAEG